MRQGGKTMDGAGPKMKDPLRLEISLYRTSAYVIRRRSLRWFPASSAMRVKILAYDVLQLRQSSLPWRWNSFPKTWWPWPPSPTKRSWAMNSINWVSCLRWGKGKDGREPSDVDFRLVCVATAAAIPQYMKHKRKSGMSRWLEHLGGKFEQEESASTILF